MTIEASYNTLVDQASTTVAGYLWQAERMLNERFGDGYAYSNPALVGQLVAAMTADFHSGALAKSLGELADVLSVKRFTPDD